MQKYTEKTAYLKPKQLAAIDALLTERTRKAAAAKAGVSERQLYKWLQDPLFKSALIEAEAAARSEIKRRIVKRAENLADTIADIMESEEASPAVRLSAAARLGDMFFRSDEQADLEQRITALEIAKYEKN